MEGIGIKKVLIANRGEIAVRVIRACKELGIKTVAVYSEVDKDSIHVALADESICIGSSKAEDSYLNIANIISACSVMGADAIHPGFGFLSENPGFARICEECNITFIGPKSETIQMMGDKSRAKDVMKEAGIPIVPGVTDNINTVDDAANIAKEIGYPVMIKAAFGGGGKGIRVVNNEEELRKQFFVAKLEAKSCFNNDKIYIEKFIESPKHIEFQILADNYGNVVHLGERDCSMQRNNQKVIEEAPSSTLTRELREKIGESAINVAKAVGYRNAGTVEFLVDKHNNYYFMEMNTRIQVEHPISEAITGVDIVKEQLKIANGCKLEIKQKDIKFVGHAIECRINAENPKKNFRPCPGTIKKLLMCGGIGIRVDSCAYENYSISSYYDSMIAKVIAYGKDREEAITRMNRALDEIVIEGIDTNIEFEKWILSQDEFIDGSYDTKYLVNKLGV